ALLASAQEEVGDIGGEPVLLAAVGTPETEAAVVPLHAEQALDAQLDRLAPLFVRLARKAQALEQRGIGIQRRIQTAGGLFQTTVGVGLERADLLAEVQRRTARQAQARFQ